MKRKNNLDKWILLSWKKTAIGLIIWIGAVFFHNIIYGIIKTFYPSWTGDEPFFFIIAVIIIPLYFIISIIYTIFKRTKKDI